MTRLKRISQAGFTGIEVLMVLIVVAIVTILVANNISQSAAKARDNQRRADILAIYEGLEAHWHTHQSYPTDVIGDIFPINEQGAISTHVADPNNNLILSNPTASSNGPAISYQADIRPDQEYTYAPYECSNPQTELTDTETEPANDQTATPEATSTETPTEEESTEEALSPDATCQKYILYTWLESPSNPTDDPASFTYQKTNLHNN